MINTRIFFPAHTRLHVHPAEQARGPDQQHADDEDQRHDQLELRCRSRNAPSTFLEHPDRQAAQHRGPTGESMPPSKRRGKNA